MCMCMLCYCTTYNSKQFIIYLCKWYLLLSMHAKYFVYVVIRIWSKETQSFCINHLKWPALRRLDRTDSKVDGIGGRWRNMKLGVSATLQVKSASVPEKGQIETMQLCSVALKLSMSELIKFPFIPCIDIIVDLDSYWQNTWSKGTWLLSAAGFAQPPGFDQDTVQLRELARLHFTQFGS